MWGTKRFSFDLLITYLFAITYSIFLLTAAPHFELLTLILFSVNRVTITSLRNKVSQLRNVMLNRSLMIDTHINYVLLLREVSNNWAIDKLTLASVVIGRVGKKGKKLPVEIIMLYLNGLSITDK